MAWWRMLHGHMLPDKKQKDFQVFLRWKERIGTPYIRLELKSHRVVDTTRILEKRAE